MATVLVSEAEKVYVLHGVQEDLRCDGRGRRDVRPIVVETDIGNICIEFTAPKGFVSNTYTELLVISRC